MNFLNSASNLHQKRFVKPLHSLCKLLSSTNAKIKRLFSEVARQPRLVPLRKDFSYFDRETNLPTIDYFSSTPVVIGETSSKWNGGTLLCVSHGNGWRTLQFGEKPMYVQSGVRCSRENIIDPEDVTFRLCFS